MSKKNVEYNLTLSPLKMRTKQATWFVDADIKDKLESVKVGDMLVLKPVDQTSPKFKKGSSPEYYLELMTKEKVEAFKAQNSGSREDEV